MVPEHPDGDGNERQDKEGPDPATGHGGDLASSTPSEHVLWSHRRTGAAMLALALLVAIGRVAVGVHWPSQVFLGALLGASTADLVATPAELTVPSYGWMTGSLPGTTMPSSTAVPLKRSTSLKPFNGVELPGSPSHVTTVKRPSSTRAGSTARSG